MVLHQNVCLNLGERVTDAIDKRGFLHSYVAKRIGITEASLSLKLHGKREFRIQEIYDICVLLGVKLDYFFPKCKI